MARGEEPCSQNAGECRARVSRNSVRLGDWASARYGHRCLDCSGIWLRSPELKVSGRDGRIAVRLRKTDLCGGGILLLDFVFLLSRARTYLSNKVQLQELVQMASGGSLIHFHPPILARLSVSLPCQPFPAGPFRLAKFVQHFWTQRCHHSQPHNCIDREMLPPPTGSTPALPGSSMCPSSCNTSARWPTCRRWETLKLPVPEIETVKPIIVRAPATAELKEFVASLAKRAEALHNGRVDPSEDKMLKITTEGRKAALDLRMMVFAPPIIRQQGKSRR